VAGLIKTVLALTHRQLPPTLNVVTPTAHIDWVTSPFYVNTALRPWEVPPGQRRRAGVSSFGIGGTNAHVIVEEAPLLPESDASRGEELLILSAKTAEALASMRGNLAAYLRAHPQLNLADVAYTLQVGRHAFTHRCAVVTKDAGAAIGVLEGNDPQSLLVSVVTGAPSTLTPQHQIDSVLSCLRQEQAGDRASRLRTLGQMWLTGVEIDWRLAHSGEHRRRVPLPLYPFARERYWIEPPPAEVAPARSPRKSSNLDEWFYVPAWRHATLLSTQE
jgi:polyketide synthase PksJ/polyketide synthase PksN